MAIINMSCQYCGDQAKLICKCGGLMCKDHKDTHEDSCEKKIKKMDDSQIKEFFSKEIHNRIEKIDKASFEIKSKSDGLVERIQNLRERSLGKLEKLKTEYMAILDKGEVQKLKEIIVKEVGVPDIKAIESFYNEDFISELNLKKLKFYSGEDMMSWLQYNHAWMIEDHESELGKIRCGGISDDNNIFVFGNKNGDTNLWNLQEKRQEAVFQGAGVSSRSVAVTHDNKFVLSGYENGEIKVWNLHEKRLEAVLQGHTDKVLLIEVTHDNTHAVSGDYLGEIRVWDLQEKCLEALLQGHTSAINSLAISHDNKYLVSGGD